MADAGIGASLRGNKITQKELISSGAGLRKLSTRIKQGIRKVFDKKDKKSKQKFTNDDDEGPPPVSGSAEPKERRRPKDLGRRGEDPRNEEACRRFDTIEIEKKEAQRRFREQEKEEKQQKRQQFDDIQRFLAFLQHYTSQQTLIALQNQRLKEQTYENAHLKDRLATLTSLFCFMSLLPNRAPTDYREPPRSSSSDEEEEMAAQSTAAAAYTPQTQSTMNETSPAPAVNPVPVPVQNAYPMMFRMPLPPPGAPGAPYFEGKNVTDFLEAFDNLCDEHSVNEVARLKKVARYCETRTRKYIQSMPDYIVGE